MEAPLRVPGPPEEEYQQSLIQPNRISSISATDSFLILCTWFVGVGICRNSGVFGCGLIFATLIHVIIALLADYSLWMLVYIMKIHKICRYSSAWRASGFKGNFIVALFIFLSVEGYISTYFHVIYSLWTKILFYYAPSAPAFLSDPYIFNFIVISSIFVPVIIRRDNHFLTYFAYIKAFMCIVFFIMNIYWCYTCNRDYKFEKVVPLFDMSQNYQAAATEYLGTYLNFYCLFTSLINMKDLTFERGVKVVRWSCVVFFIFAHGIAIIQYFMFYQDRTEALLIDQLDFSDMSVQVGVIIYMIIIVTSIPAYLDPVRVVSLFFVQEMDRYPVYIWSVIGYIWLFLAVLLSPLFDRYFAALALLSNICLLLQFAGPGMMLIKVMHTGISKAHWIGIVLNIFIGCGLALWGIISLAGAV
jgi:hypothetical protein